MFNLINSYPSTAAIIYVLSAAISTYFIEYAIKRMSLIGMVSKAQKQVMYAYTLIPVLNTIYATICLARFSKTFFGKQHKRN